MMAPQNPYLIYGSVNAGILSVSALNLRTNETQTIATAGDNSFVVDCANFTSGYNNSDPVQLSAAGFTAQNIVIDTKYYPDGLQVNFLSSSTTYTTAAKVASLLRLINPTTQARKVFDTTTDPTLAEVNNFIFEAEDVIDKDTNHAWRPVTVTNEYHNVGRLYTGFYRRELPIKLKHRSIRTFTSGTDKIEHWDGSNWVDLVLASNGYTEGRAQDYWVDYTSGIVYFISLKPYYAEKGVRFTYRYGEASVPYDIQECATKFAACKILENEDYKINVPEGLNNQYALGSKVDSWKKDIRRILENHREHFSAI